MGTNDEIVKSGSRSEIWLCLSELYLDTEIQDNSYVLLAKQITKIGYTYKEIRAIDKFEVFSALRYNLMTPAGVWDGFDQEWLIEKCKANQRKSKNPFFRMGVHLSSLLLSSTLKCDWKKIEALINVES